jgi:hypothetical protein
MQTNLMGKYAFLLGRRGDVCRWGNYKKGKLT